MDGKPASSALQRFFSMWYPNRVPEVGAGVKGRWSAWEGDPFSLRRWHTLLHYQRNMSGTVFRFCVVFWCILDISSLMVSEMRNENTCLSTQILFFSKSSRNSQSCSHFRTFKMGGYREVATTFSGDNSSAFLKPSLHDAALLTL